MEIMLAPGESGDFAARARRLDVVADPLFSRRDFAVAQSVFLKSVVGGKDLNWTQGDNFAFEHEANVIPLHGLLEPVPEPSSAFRNG